MKKLFFIGFIGFCSSVCFSETYNKKYNPFTGEPDYVVNMSSTSIGTRVIMNQSTLQSGATFYVEKGSIGPSGDGYELTTISDEIIGIPWYMRSTRPMAVGNALRWSWTMMADTMVGEMEVEGGYCQATMEDITELSNDSMFEIGVKREDQTRPLLWVSGNQNKVYIGTNTSTGLNVDGVISASTVTFSSATITSLSGSNINVSTAVLSNSLTINGTANNSLALGTLSGSYNSNYAYISNQDIGGGIGTNYRVLELEGKVTSTANSRTLGIYHVMEYEGLGTTGGAMYCSTVDKSTSTSTPNTTGIQFVVNRASNFNAQASGGAMTSLQLAMTDSGKYTRNDGNIVPITSYLMNGTATISPTVGYDGLSHSVTYTNYGNRAAFAGTPVLAAGYTGTFTNNQYAFSVGGAGNTVGTSIMKAFYAKPNSGTTFGYDTNWIFYNETVDHNFLGLDNSKTYWGTDSELSIYHNGTDSYVENTNGKLVITSTSTVEIGTGTAGVDYQLSFNGESNDGSLTWMEDENYLTLPTINTTSGTLTNIISSTVSVSNTLTIPHGSNPYVDGNGEISVDTTSAMIVYYSEGVKTLYPKETRTVILWDDGDWNSEEIPLLDFPDVAGTIVAVRSSSLGSSTPTLTFNIEERPWGTDITTAGTNITGSTIVSDADGTETTSFSNAGIAAKAHLVLTTAASSAESGTVDAVVITIEYTVDRT